MVARNGKIMIQENHDTYIQNLSTHIMYVVQLKLAITIQKNAQPYLFIYSRRNEFKNRGLIIFTQNYIHSIKYYLSINQMSQYLQSQSTRSSISNLSSNCNMQNNKNSQLIKKQWEKIKKTLFPSQKLENFFHQIITYIQVLEAENLHIQNDKNQEESQKKKAIALLNCAQDQVLELKAKLNCSQLELKHAIEVQQIKTQRTNFQLNRQKDKIKQLQKRSDQIKNKIFQFDKKQQKFRTDRFQNLSEHKRNEERKNEHMRKQQKISEEYYYYSRFDKGSAILNPKEKKN